MIVEFDVSTELLDTFIVLCHAQKVGNKLNKTFIAGEFIIVIIAAVGGLFSIPITFPIFDSMTTNRYDFLTPGIFAFATNIFVIGAVLSTIWYFRIKNLKQ